MSFSDLKLFALSSNKELAERVAQEIGIELGKSTVRQFSDGEIQVNIEESIRGKHVFILQSTSSPVNDNLLEILIMVAYNDETFGAYKSALQESLLNQLGYTNVATGTSGLTLENLVSMDPELIIYVMKHMNT